MSPTRTTEEPKQTLPSGHPEAGYVRPDLSLQDGTGKLPESEQEWHDDRDEAREAEVEAVTANEDKTARAEAKTAEAKQPEAAPKAAPKS